MDTEERLTTLEQISGLLVKVTRSAHERMDTLAEAQANTEVKLAALTDAQIRTETRLDKLAEAQANSERKIAALADAQIRTEARMETLFAAQANSEARIAALAEAQARLADTQAHADQRLDALIDVVRKRLESER